MLVNFDKFKKIYNDKDLKFFYKLLPDVKNYFKNIVWSLEQSIKENKRGEWFGTLLAMQSIATDMCFDRLKNYTVKMDKPNKKDFKEIKIMIEEILLLEIKIFSKWNRFW